MPLVVRIARYSGDELPHPAHLHALLRSSSCTSEHDKLLRWWERLEPPELHTAHGAGAFGFVWTGVEPTAEQLHVMRDLVQRVPGRTIPEWREWSVVTHAAGDGAGIRYVPGGESNGTTLRIAAPGFTDALESVRDQGIEEWAKVAAVQQYQRVEVPQWIPSGHGEMQCFRFPPGVTVDGTECGAVTTRLRGAVLARVPNPLPPEVSGHGANGRPHVGYVPLLAAGERSVDLVGVAVVFPRDAGEWADSVKSALLDGPRPLWIPSGSARMNLIPGAGADSLPEARPEHWTGPARTWVTVTPMVLDRFPKRRTESEIARSCVRLGLPEPVRVRASETPITASGVDLRRGQLPRRDKRPYTHARIEFPIPVQGPVLLGAQRHVGMGLCLPESFENSAAGVPLA